MKNGAEPPDAEPDGVDRPRRLGLLLTVGAIIFALDLASKLVVVATLSDQPPLKLLGGLIYLTEARNTGAAFGLAQGMTVVFTLVAAVVIVVILKIAPRLRSAGWAWALGLVVGGALGNLMDRIFRSPGVFRGGVVDFVSILDPAGQVWPIFNVADSAIVSGGLLGIVMALRGRDFDGARTH
ncbi:MAG: signal peptidase II [Geodermatophilaceae bacterium]|nr:signal peptidase II [Geodermatophilaceae bacterium]